jgi:hypothetical protein
MAEIFTLTTPITQPVRNTYIVERLILDWTAQVVQVYLMGSDGVEVFNQWTGASAVTLMTAMNSANFTVNSLYKNILLQLIAAGKIPAGTVSGTPS